jgi:hypothetical protein
VAQAGNLKVLNLTGANFTTDLSISSCPASGNETGWNTYNDDEHTWTGVTKGTTNTRHFGSYTNGWGGTIYGYSIENELGAGMFANSPNLQEVWLPTSILTIGTGSFYNCPNLKMVYVPATITKFGWECFSGDKNLLTLIPSGSATNFPNVTCINSSAFQDCTSLPTATFEKFPNATTIGYRAFKNTKIELTAAQQIINNFQYGNVSSSNGDYHNLPYEIFAGCTEIKGSLFVPNNSQTYIQGIGVSAFAGCTGISLVNINSAVASIGNNAFDGCSALTTVTLPPNLTTIGVKAFAGCPITSLTVTNSVAPTTCAGSESATEDDPFSGATPNTCTVHFPEDALATNESGFDGTTDLPSGITSGYKTYYQKWAFMRLLTKTLSEDDETYTVAPQMHAIVKLTRTFKQGWNTLCLPFGSPRYSAANTGSQNGYNYSGFNLYHKALYGSFVTSTDDNKDNSDFRIGGYRGVKNNETFMFLNTTEWISDYGFDEFEPLYVYFKTAPTGPFTFTDVNLNYDHDHPTTGATTYTAAETAALYASYDFSGTANSDHFNTFTHDYKFVGTFCKIQDSNNGDKKVFGSDSYYLQNNKVYAYDDNHKYGSKGFRAWFHNKNASNAKASFAVDVVGDDDQSVTGIMNMSADGEQIQPANIYNVNGQLVRANATSTEDLVKGIYIVKGKKVVVK